MGLTTVLVSTASHEGLRELTFVLSDLVQTMRQKVRQVEEPQETGQERVVLHPLENKSRRRNSGPGTVGVDFDVVRHEDKNGHVWFAVTGNKPERWILQTNFDNEEAVGYLADRLAKLGVEDALKAKGARLGDEVYIGQGDNAVGFDWDPTISAGAQMLDDNPQAQRGHDARLDALEEARVHRRTNVERRREYHQWMDAKAAVRQAMEKERAAGHWNDPSRNDDPHDTQGLENYEAQ